MAKREDKLTRIERDLSECQLKMVKLAQAFKAEQARQYPQLELLAEYIFSSMEKYISSLKRQPAATWYQLEGVEKELYRQVAIQYLIDSDKLSGLLNRGGKKIPGGKNKRTDLENDASLPLRHMLSSGGRPINGKTVGFKL